ncbi:hypothetical protein BDZ91DRAFT_545888 [Kalaharituber pfeilii]|nr:hypothetical protein BDZ91DRAFT_545888 [Kalaharituber pfeilii]
MFILSCPLVHYYILRFHFSFHVPCIFFPRYVMYLIYLHWGFFSRSLILTFPLLQPLPLSCISSWSESHVYVNHYINKKGDFYYKRNFDIYVTTTTKPLLRIYTYTAGGVWLGR